MIEQAILIGLAAWRLAALLSYERGPFGLFIKSRERMGFEHDGTGEPVSWPARPWNDLIGCVWCLSPWMAAASYGLWLLEPLVVVVIAASAVVVIVERWVKP